jgi:flagellar biosynthesis protein FlhF
MRLKAFHAATAEDAIRLIQRELGDDALVVSTETDASGVRVMVAVEEIRDAPEPGFAIHAVDDEDEREPVEPPPAPRFGRGAPPPEKDALARILEFHGVPAMLAARLEDGAKLGRHGSDASAGVALAQRLAGLFRFAPLAGLAGGNGPVLIVGPPGAGKTLAVAKLAAQAIMEGGRVRLVTTDRNSAGGLPALAAFAKILDVPFDIADRPEDLQRFAFAARDATPLIVDTAAVNPNSPAELASLARLVVATGGEPVLVLPAGLDVAESVDTAEAFARIGCTRLIATRLDISRRMGGLLAAAASGTYAFAEISASSSPAEALEAVDANRFARILVAAAAQARAARSQETAS